MTFILIFPVELSFLSEHFVFPCANTVQREQSLVIDGVFAEQRTREGAVIVLLGSDSERKGHRSLGDV